MKILMMRKGLIMALSLATLLLTGTVYIGVSAHVNHGTTTPSGVSIQALAPTAQYDEIKSKAKDGDWEADLKTKGVSDLHVVEVTIQPGGTIGWHSHRGWSFVTVKSGTATFYEADDPTCSPIVVTSGSSLFEPADKIHIARNEGAVPLVSVVVQLIPTGAPRLRSEPNPGNCPF